MTNAAENKPFKRLVWINIFGYKDIRICFLKIGNNGGFKFGHAAKRFIETVGKTI